MQFSGVSHRKKENKNARKVYFGKAGDLREREEYLYLSVITVAIYGRS